MLRALNLYENENTPRASHKTAVFPLHFSLGRTHLRNKITGDIEPLQAPTVHSAALSVGVGFARQARIFRDIDGLGGLKYQTRKRIITIMLF